MSRAAKIGSFTCFSVALECAASKCTNVSWPLLCACGKLTKRINGVPQGSPLSPLLSNIMLHELDKELENQQREIELLGIASSLDYCFDCHTLAHNA